MRFLSGITILLIFWVTASLLLNVNPLFLPSPMDVGSKLVELISSGELFVNSWATLIKTLQAFALAVIIGVPLGLFLGMHRKLYESVEFIIDFFRSMPATAMFPLFLLIFGVGSFAKVSVTTFAAVMVIVFNTAYGVFNGTAIRTKAAQIMGASRRQLFTLITIWESLPQTFVGLRNAISLSLVIIVVTEMFIGSNLGIGKQIIDAQIVYNTAEMYSYIITAGTLGYLLNLSVQYLERKIVHWNSN